jgi:hypothetical protein
MKYCLVDKQTNTKASRFFKTRTQAELRCIAKKHIIKTKTECIEKGIYIIPKKKFIGNHMPIENVKGIFMDDKYKKVYANAVNRQNYIDFCKQNGFVYSL